FVPFSIFFLFIAPSTSHCYTLSLHDALPIYMALLEHRHLVPRSAADQPRIQAVGRGEAGVVETVAPEEPVPVRKLMVDSGCDERSEEHTSELQSHLNLVCRLLLEKKKQASKQ